MTEEAFDAAWRRGEVGHVGLAESAWLVADACGFDPEEVEVEEGVEALVADQARPGGAWPIAAGQVAGFEQVARAFVGGTERIRLELVVQFGAEDPHDEVEVEATSTLRLRIDGGVAGDEATAWAVVNAAPAVVQRQGLITVLELPVGR
jgi:4-hydroxy-tetrahydrodipicolinate reductase